MTSFEERKKEYLEKIGSNPEVLKRIIKDTRKSNRESEMIAIMTRPETERDLLIAKTLFLVTNDAMNLMNDVVNGTVKSIPMEENEGIKSYVEELKTLKGINNSSPSVNERTPKEEAKKMYGLIVAITDYGRSAIDYIAYQAGFNLEDQNELSQFLVFMDVLKITNGDTSIANVDFQICSDEEINQVKELAEEFHQLCISGRKEFEEESITSKKARMIVKSLVKSIKGDRK
jgi:hypothetical protein